MSKAMALEWLNAANDDLLLIGSIIENVHLTHLAAFHAQQAVEKSFKAILEYYGRNVPKNHDLLTLGGLLGDCFQVDAADILESLNSLYIEARYPGNLGLLPNGKPTIKEAEVFFDFAKTVYSRALGIIKGG